MVTILQTHGQGGHPSWTVWTSRQNTEESPAGQGDCGDPGGVLHDGKLQNYWGSRYKDKRRKQGRDRGGAQRKATGLGKVQAKLVDAFPSSTDLWC